jgi:hypothetical protein
MILYAELATFVVKPVGDLAAWIATEGPDPAKGLFIFHWAEPALIGTHAYGLDMSGVSRPAARALGDRPRGTFNRFAPAGVALGGRSGPSISELLSFVGSDTRCRDVLELKLSTDDSHLFLMKRPH